MTALGDRVFGNFDLSLGFDWRIGTFLGLSLAAIAVSFAAASAWQVGRLQGSEALKEAGRGIVGTNSTSQKILLHCRLL